MPASSAARAKAIRSSNRVASGRAPCSTWSKSPIFIKSSAGWILLVYLRFGDLPLAGEEVEIAAFVGLADMGGEHGAVAAKIARRRWLPGRTAAVELLLAHVQMDAPRRDVDLDLVTVLDECQRTADEALRRHVQNAGAVAGAAHTTVRDAHHVAHPRLHQPLRDREHAPFRHAGA